MVRGGCDCAKGRLGRQHSDSHHLASRACSAQGPLMRHRPNAEGVSCAQRYRRRPASDMLGSPFFLLWSGDSKRQPQAGDQDPL